MEIANLESFLGCLKLLVPSMGWCTHCEDDCPTVRDPDKGYM